MLAGVCAACTRVIVNDLIKETCYPSLQPTYTDEGMHGAGDGSSDTIKRAAPHAAR